MQARVYTHVRACVKCGAVGQRTTVGQEEEGRHSQAFISFQWNKRQIWELSYKLELYLLGTHFYVHLCSLLSTVAPDRAGGRTIALILTDLQRCPPPHPWEFSLPPGPSSALCCRENTSVLLHPNSSLPRPVSHGHLTFLGSRKNAPQASDLCFNFFISFSPLFSSK